MTSVPTFDARPEHGALGLHLVEAPVEPALLHLELGDAVAQQPADPVGPLEHRDVVPDAGELLGRGQPGGPGPDDGDLLARLRRRRLRDDPALAPTRGRSICSSTCLIVTASLLIASTQAASHGAGHSVPVNSGKLFVACSRSMASRHSSR